MRYIKFRQDGEIHSALVTLQEEIYVIKEEDYTEFYYGLKESNLTAKEYIEKEQLQKSELKFEDLELNLPILPDEVWAAGVTYQKSREARNFETKKDAEQDLTFYDLVYDAERPEIFFKSTARRIIGPNEDVCIRTDSNWQIPEPELTLIVGKKEDIIGYTLGNDMSCRDIEGENPLYLPQAKVWKNSGSIGPAILMPEAVEDPYSIDITCKIYRDGQLKFEGTAYVNQLKRKLDELVHYLVYDNDILEGTALMTGTCIVPPNDFTLQAGDTIEISSTKIGILRNDVSAP
ncbi:fumarylacetoacetate hydrolase family protein [Sporosarcina aquimarina]|uniref:fumarylacetoacetate hydrolase family protein n=1 Tax=Sporosarcina aquimarina TaxID=114975 RepID=UPI001C8DB6FA|nr:fumarylacetoacetate hydrolase family protein [Sporosarcina aquimarina]MBY0223172.1 fumarylacetoacetate hydrolase family protein [Sporosarcina aquimarina]